MGTVIVALDPGGTTGWAMLAISDRGRTYWDLGQLGPDEHHLELYNMIDRMYARAQDDNFIIVCERFEYRAYSRPGLVLDSREYIGVAKLFAAQKQVPFVLQSAAQGKGLVTDQNIKKLGLWSAGNRHAMDALRHLLYYVIKGTDVPFDALAVAPDLLHEGWK